MKNIVEKMMIRRMEAGDYERGFLGRVDTTEKDYQKALEEVKKHSRNPGLNYLVERKDAFDLARGFQPRNLETGKRAEPTEPKGALLNALRQSLFKILRKFELGDGDIKAYTAVDTPADFLYGTDAFMDIAGQIITLDITLRQRKLGKAQIIIDQDLIRGKLADPKASEEEKKKFKQQVEIIAEEIYRQIDKKQLEEYCQN